MDEFIEKYKKSRKQKPLLLVDLFLGCVLLIYTLVYCCTSWFDNIWTYIIMFIIICLIFKSIKYWIKLFLIYDYNQKLYWKRLYNPKVNQLYRQKIDSENLKYIKQNLGMMSNQQLDIFYNYLCDTKNNIEFLKFKDILLMGISFAIGASFDDKAFISTNLLTNALNSILGCFLGLTPFYLIFFKINTAYIKLCNDNIIKCELIEYISRIRFNNKNH